jgi:primosomal protein N' (replication factor Y) (superfamily II helicase)
MLFHLAPATVEAPASSVRQPVARVQLEDNAGLELDYAIPEELVAKVRIGTRVMVPLQRQRVPGVVLALLDESPHGHRLKPLIGLRGRGDPVFTPALIKLAHWIADYYFCPVHQVLRTMLPQAVRAKPESFLTDSEVQIIKPLTEEEHEKLRKKAPMQARLLEEITRMGGKATLSALRRELPQATTLMKSLIDKGVLSRAEIRVDRDPFEEDEFLPSQPLKMTDEQQVAHDSVLESLKLPKEARPILLHGVTGSGKTEVFLQTIAHVLSQGQTALVLVPEIALTPQTIERFKARFHERAERIAVLHSHLSEGERHDEWYKVHERRADIVIGARSAIFAPLENLGIIIVDEEHEPSYKQEEAPRYNARDLAVVRAKIEGCVVLLATATPSLETFHNATTGKYELLRLTKRTDGKAMPLIRVVDLRLERKRGSDSPDTRVLSEKLRHAIIARLEKNQQVILFLNRRGYNTSLSCMACGHVCTCQDCAVPMTLHKADDRLVCHVCGSRRVPPRKCPGCQDPGIRFAGFGTERVEQVLRTAFPQAKLARVDTDTMQRKNQLRDTLRDFRARKLDMLIGTQMIAKGLDFPNVTLVGVLNADLGLNLPDFRAAERTFQLLVQVAGRAGRGEVRGEVLVQTFAPHVPAVAFARHTDYEGFAQQEFEQRAAFHYPPNTHVMLLTARSKNAAMAEFSLQTLQGKLRPALDEEVRMSEVMPSPLAKAHGQFRFQLLLRTAKIRPAVRALRGVVDQITFPPDVIVTWDVDAMSLM